MKDKLEIGMYCYNKTNRKMGIGKIISFQSNNNINVKYKNDIELVSIGNLEASYNIIDLIEENDYINGLRVEKNKYGELYTSYVYYGGDIGKMCEVYTIWLKEYKKDEIYSIVTSQQFESLEYKVD